MRRPSDLQIVYQRNMTLGLIGATLLSFVTVLLAPGSPDPGGPTSTGHGALPNDTEIAVILTAASGDLWGGNGLTVKPARHRKPLSGYVGSRWKIVSDPKPGPIPAIAPPRQMALVPDEPLLSSSDGDMALASFDDDRYGSGGPSFAGYGGIGGDGYGGSGPGRGAVDFEVRLIHVVDPEYPRVARMDGINGKVSVLVRVDAGGRMVDFPLERQNGQVEAVPFLILDEDPPGWFFADKVAETVPTWTFRPRVRQGRPLPAFLKITYYFCMRRHDCPGVEIVPLSGY